MADTLEIVDENFIETKTIWETERCLQLSSAHITPETDKELECIAKGEQPAPDAFDVFYNKDVGAIILWIDRDEITKEPLTDKFSPDLAQCLTAAKNTQSTMICISASGPISDTLVRYAW